MHSVSNPSFISHVATQFEMSLLDSLLTVLKGMSSLRKSLACIGITRSEDQKRGFAGHRGSMIAGKKASEARPNLPAGW